MTSVSPISLVVQAPVNKGPPQKCKTVLQRKKKMKGSYNTQHAFFQVFMLVYRDYR